MIRTLWLVLGVVVGFAGWGANATAQQTAAPVTPPSVATPATVTAPATVAAPGTVVGTPVYGAPIYREPIYGAPIAGGMVMGRGSYAAAPNAGTRSGAIMPYSYYVNFPEPSRIYVGYGPNDGFPFHGQPYGHAGDRWSWAAMSTGGGSLAKYYYQLLP